MGSTPKAPEKTAEEKAMEIRQRIELDKEVAKNEGRLKAIARGKLGKASLLGNPQEEEDMAGRKPRTIFDAAGVESGSDLTGASGDGQTMTRGYGITNSGKLKKKAVSTTGGGRDQSRIDTINKRDFGPKSSNKGRGRNK